MQIDLELPCPCCGRPFPPKLAISGFVRRRLVDLIASRPDGITTPDLHAFIYSTSPDKAPPLKIISAHVYYANKEIRPQGYEIVAFWRGPGGACYGLRKIDADPKREPARGQHHSGLEGTQSTIAAREY